MSETPTTQPTGLWALTSTGESLETGDSWSFTTIYGTRAEAIAAAEEMAADILAEGDKNIEATHLQADDEGGPRSDWGYGNEAETEWGGLTVQPLRLGVTYGG